MQTATVKAKNNDISKHHLNTTQFQMFTLSEDKMHIIENK